MRGRHFFFNHIYFLDGRAHEGIVRNNWSLEPPLADIEPPQMDTGVHGPFACARLVWEMAVLTASGMMWFHWGITFAAEVRHRKAIGSHNILSKHDSSAPESHGLKTLKQSSWAQNIMPVTGNLDLD